jgi:hypothetical protein
MVFGDPFNEDIQLNENTVWAGQPNRNDNPDSKEALPEVRKLIFEGKYREAQDLINQKFITKISHGFIRLSATSAYLLRSKLHRILQGSISICAIVPDIALTE